MARDKSWIKEKAQTRSTKEALRRINRGELEDALVPRGDGSLVFRGLAITPVGIQFPDDVSVEDFKLLGRDFLMKAEIAMQWWIGDWIVKAENKKWREHVETIAAEFDREIKTIDDYAYVARNVPFSVRTEKLKFGHHKLVAHMVEEDQERWLTDAIENDWSIAQMRIAIHGEPRKYANMRYRPGDVGHLADTIYSSLDANDVIDLIERLNARLGN